MGLFDLRFTRLQTSLTGGFRLRDYAVAIFRTANDSMRRVMPEMKMLMPNSVPTTQAEFQGQWNQIRTPSRRVMMPSNSTHPQPRRGFIWKASTRAKIRTPAGMTRAISVSASKPAAWMHQQINSGDYVDDPQDNFQKYVPAAVGAEAEDDLGNAVEDRATSLRLSVMTNPVPREPAWR